MKKILALALILVLGLGVWWMTRGGPEEITPAAPGQAATPEASEPATVEPLADPGPATTRTADAATETPSTPAPEPAAVAATEPDPEPVPPTIDADGRAWLTLEIVDGEGAGVPGAEISMDGLRSRIEPGAHYMWSDDPCTAITESDGRARVWYPPTVNGDTTGFVSFSVKHPDFVTLRPTSFDVSEGGGTLTLERGSFLIVSGYLPSGETVDGIVPKVSDEARVRTNDWNPMGDGRIATSRIPAGTHALWVTYRSPAGEVYHSEVTPFTLTAGDQHELAIALLPGLTMTGRLDESVPRPVTNGGVILNMSLGEHGGAHMMRPFRATVQADGTFELRNLPQGTGEIIGICDGWVSAKVKPRVADHDEDGGPPTDELELQFVEIPLKGEYAVAMEATATLAVNVEGPDGSPLAGATVNLWPNVRWRNGYSQMFFGKNFQATSGSGGLAVVEGIVPGEHPFVVFHPEFEMDVGEVQPGTLSEEQQVDLASGERVERTVRMRKKSSD